ncbi:helix-turn-helix transcriptional regulator [Ochrobactrum sp. BTU1]|uniref:helix-turn-helix transcriptional regulator n=1 Tax=Ochrobactrum sp. BTU1 TaxID=2840456 RepID=UPI001C044F4E|nr:PAS domain-containing protein [Ochrobactrum sp. BTU1]
MNRILIKENSPLSHNISPNLLPYVPICDAIATLFAPFAEVVLHDLPSASVVHIAGNFSKRELGDPSNLDEINFTPADRLIGPYAKTNWDGRRIKSISSVLRTSKGKEIGVLCINADMSVFESMVLTLQNFVSVPSASGEMESLFRDDWFERINNYIQHWTAARGLNISDLSRSQKKELVQALADSGAFSGKNAAGYICRLLGMGRATVYNYLNGNSGPDDETA